MYHFDHMCVVCGLLVQDRPPDSTEFWLCQYRISEPLLRFYILITLTPSLN
jgi:hypothetical protein